MKRNILMVGQRLRDGIKMTFGWTQKPLFRISGLTESEKSCENIWGTRKFTGNQPKTMLRKKISYKNTYGRSAARLFSSVNVPFMINDFCSSTNIRLCVSSRLCPNRNKFCEDFVCWRTSPRNLGGGLNPENVLILMETMRKLVGNRMEEMKDSVLVKWRRTLNV